MLPHDPPGPIPSPADAGFWAACGQHELRLRHCRPCGAWHHPPMPLCPRCQSPELEWRVVEGPAVLYSWTRVHVAMHPSVADVLPYYIAVVEFPACAAARLVTYLDHADTGPPAIGAECELCWLAAAGGQPVPAFRTPPRAGPGPAQ